MSLNDNIPSGFTGRWTQGRLLDTHKTRRWTPEQRRNTNASESVRVFAHFTEADQGHGRVLICQCQTPDAAEYVAMCGTRNALMHAIEPLRMPPNPKLVMLHLALMADEGASCWPSFGVMADVTCLGLDSVDIAFTYLCRHHAIMLTEEGETPNTTLRHVTLTPESFKP